VSRPEIVLFTFLLHFIYQMTRAVPILKNLPIKSDPKCQCFPVTILHSKHSLYGLKQSPRTIFKYLKSYFEKCGFRDSSLDSDFCLFVSDTAICIDCVDDARLWSPKNTWINAAMSQLQRTGLSLELEDSVAGFLGVHNARNQSDGSTKLQQDGIINLIIAVIGMENAPAGHPPTSTILITTDADFEGLWPPWGQTLAVSGILVVQTSWPHRYFDNGVQVFCTFDGHASRVTLAETSNHVIPFDWSSQQSSYIFSSNNTRGQRRCSDLGQFGTWQHHTSVKTLCGHVASVQKQA
jgi:hypothetical protein